MWSGKFKNGESFNDLTDAEIEKFADQIDPASAKETSTVSEKGKEVSTADSNLYSKALQVGYSGLSKEDQSKLEYAYAKSNAAKTKSFDQVKTEMDANAAASRQMAEQSKAEAPLIPVITSDKIELPGNSNETITFDNQSRPIGEALKNVYKLGRDVLSYPAAGVIGSLEYLANKGFGSFGQASSADYNREYPETLQRSLESAQKGEGLTGMASDPINLVAGGLGRARALGELGPLAGKSTLGKMASHTVEGAGLGAGQAYLNNGTGSDIVVGGLLGGGLHPLTSYVLPADQTAIDKFKEQAIREFPGTRYIETQARKAGEHVTDMPGYMTDAEKLATLKAISKQSGSTPGLNDWIDYKNKFEDISDKGYAIANEKAKVNRKFQNEIGPLEDNPTTIPFDDLRERMIDKIGVGSYTEEKATKFVDNLLAGRRQQYGEEIPIEKLSEIKHQLNEQWADPKLQKTTKDVPKVTMSRKAGQVISDIWNNDKRFVVPTGKDAAGNYTFAIVTYNELVTKEAIDAFKKKEAIYDIFSQQSVPTTSQRTAGGGSILERALNGIMSGGKKVYKSTGDAYGDPINLYRKYEKGPSPIAGSILGIVPTVGSETPLAVRKKIENKKTK